MRTGLFSLIHPECPTCLGNRFLGDSGISSQRPWQKRAPPGTYIPEARKLSGLSFAAITLLGRHGGGLCNCPRCSSAGLPACAAAQPGTWAPLARRAEPERGPPRPSAKQQGGRPQGPVKHPERRQDPAKPRLRLLAPFAARTAQRELHVYEPSLQGWGVGWGGEGRC